MHGKQGDLFVPLSVASVIFSLLHAVKMLPPHTSFSPGSLWKGRRFILICMACGETETALGMKRRIFEWRGAICFSGKGIAYPLVGSEMFMF